MLDNLILLAKKIDDLGKDVVVPLLRFTETYDVDQKIAERAYRPDLMEKELKILAQIDRQIAKAMDNLVRAKEYKKYYGCLAIEAQSNKMLNLPAQIYQQFRKGVIGVRRRIRIPINQFSRIARPKKNLNSRVFCQFRS